MRTSKLTAETKSGSVQALELIFAEALRATRKITDVPDIHARFYPYAGLSSTIRLREGRVYVRVSDILEGSPADVLYALACILICKLYRRKSPQEQLRVYREYTLQPAIVSQSDVIRKRRGFKVLTSPTGKAYDLNESFDHLNAHYFEGHLEKPRLTWSPGISRRVLGHHDHVHGTIVVSRALDSQKIPRFVLEFVLYHEMLHIKHPPRAQGNRTIYHGPEFRADERLYERFSEAGQWLSQIATPVRRRRKRRRSPARR